MNWSPERIGNLNFVIYRLRVHAMPTVAAMTIAVFTTLPAALVTSMYSCTALSRSWSRSRGLPCAFIGKHFTTGASPSFLLWANARMYSTFSLLVVDSVIFQQRTLEKYLAAQVLPFSRAYLPPCALLYLPRGIVFSCAIRARASHYVIKILHN